MLPATTTDMPMQPGPLSDTHSGESERPSGAATPLAPDTFSITPEDATILKGYLVDFQKAETEVRKKILEQAMGEIYALHPLASAFDKKEAKQVCGPELHECFADVSLCTRKSEHGSTTTMIAPTASSSNSPGSGQAGIHSTMRTR